MRPHARTYLYNKISAKMDPTSIEDGVKLDEGLGWGKSLPVPSVQEMVRNDVECVPERFIQDYEDNKRELNKLDFACKVMQ